MTKLRVVDLDDRLRPVPTSFLLKVIPSLLSTLPLPAALAHPTANNKKVKKTKAGPTANAKEQTKATVSEADEVDLVDALDAADCGRTVGLAILSWFGEPVEARPDRWKFDVDQIVRELGIVLLAAGGVSLTPPLPVLLDPNSNDTEFDVLVGAAKQFGKQPCDAFVDKWRGLCGGFAPLVDISRLAVSLSARRHDFFCLCARPPPRR